MPIVIPEFVQYQGVMIPLRGLWNSPAPEGDRFVNIEVDWGTPGLFGVSCVQFAVSGNSPVQFSQIAAISVDNSRCGSDVDFIFPDSGFVLTVPAYNQGVYPIFSNALMFYINSPLSSLGDITIAQILNSVPPPVAIQPSEEQSQAAAPTLSLSTPGSTVLVPAPRSGTVQAFAIAVASDAGTAGFTTLSLVDGTGKVLYSAEFVIPAGVFSQTIPVTGIRLRFTNGLNAVVAASTVAAGVTATVNVYYSTP